MNKGILFWNLTLKQCLAFIQKNQAFCETGGEMRLNEYYRLPAGNVASRFFRLLLVLLLYVFSQQVPAQGEAYLPLNTKGLKHEKIIRALYYGQFERIPLADPIVSLNSLILELSVACFPRLMSRRSRISASTISDRIRDKFSIP